MKADAIQRENCGGMSDLVRLLVVLSDTGHNSCGLSDQAYKLEQEIENSLEWQKWRKASRRLKRR